MVLLVVLMAASETSSKASLCLSFKGPGFQDLIRPTRLRRLPPSLQRGCFRDAYPLQMLFLIVHSFIFRRLAGTLALMSATPACVSKCLPSPWTSHLHCRHEFAGKNPERPSLHTLQVRAAFCCALVAIAPLALPFVEC